MKFRITQYVESYQTYEIEADDETSARMLINRLNQGEISPDDIDGELVNDNPVEGGDFILSNWRG
jgi:hypothetical protein